MSLDQKRNNRSSETKADWRVELRGLATEEYINSCTRIAAIDYPGYLTFTSKDEELTRSQVYWKDTIDRRLQCKHQGLCQLGEGLQRKWDKNVYKDADDMHWALQKRKRSAKLQSVAVTSLADAFVNKKVKLMLQEEVDSFPGSAITDSRPSGSAIAESSGEHDGENDRDEIVAHDIEDNENEDSGKGAFTTTSLKNLGSLGKFSARRRRCGRIG